MSPSSTQPVNTRAPSPRPYLARPPIQQALEPVPLPTSELVVAGFGGGLGPRVPPGSLTADAREWMPAQGLRVARSAGREGRLVGGASPGWRPLPTGTALCLSLSLPPSRRRSEAVLPASSSRSPRGRCARSVTASLDRDSPEPPAPQRRQPRGAGVVGSPASPPPDRDRAGPAAGVSLRGRCASGSDCWFPRGGSRRQSRSVCLSVRPRAFCPGSGAGRTSYSHPPGQRPSSTGHLRPQGIIALGPAGLGQGKAADSGAPCWRGLCHPPGGF